MSSLAGMRRYLDDQNMLFEEKMRPQERVHVELLGQGLMEALAAHFVRDAVHVFKHEVDGVWNLGLYNVDNPPRENFPVAKESITMLRWYDLRNE